MARIDGAQKRFKIWHTSCGYRLGDARSTARSVAASSLSLHVKGRRMYRETIEQFVNSAVAKSEMLRRLPLAFFVSAMMAGAYVGIGIILIFSVGSDLDPSLRPLVMGDRKSVV